MSTREQLFRICLVGLVGGTVPACHDASTAPGTGSDTVLVTGGEAHHLTVVAPGTGQLVGSVGPLPQFQDMFARSPDSATLYLTAFDSAGRVLLAVDTHSQGIVWRESLSDPVRFQGTSVAGDYGLAVSPDEQRLFVASARRAAPADTSPGIAVLDAASRDLIGFIGPLWVQPGGLATMLPGPALTRGAILVVGRRQREEQPSQDWLFVFDPQTLTVVDSAAIAQPHAGSGPTLAGVFPARDGRTVYVTSVDSLYHFDLVTKEILARTPLPGLSGDIAFSPDGRTMYVTDGGDLFDTPGSGQIAVFDADLNPQPPIDLRTSAAVNGQPPSMQGAAVSSDGRMLYVAAGTPSRGPLYGPQPARLLVVDCRTRRLLRAIPLNDWAPAGIYVY